MKLPVFIGILILALICAIFERTGVSLLFIAFGVAFVENALSLSTSPQKELDTSAKDFRSAYAIIYSKYIYGLSLLLLFLLFKYFQLRNQQYDLGIIFVISIGLLFAFLRLAPRELLSYFDNQRVVQAKDYRHRLVRAKTDPVIEDRLQAYIEGWLANLPDKDVRIITLARLMSKRLKNSALKDEELISAFEKVDFNLAAKPYSVAETIEMLQRLYDAM